MNTKIIKVSIALFAVVLCLCVAGVMYLSMWLNSSLGVEKNYVIKKGGSLYSVASDLHQSDVIKLPSLWVLYARLSRQTSIKAGEYRVSANDSPASLLARFQQGDVIQHQITFVEGTTFKEMLALLHRDIRVTNRVDPEEPLKSLRAAGIKVDHPEGWFFPDTYQFTTGATDLSILSRAYNKLQLALHEQWQSRAEDLPYSNAYDALIMASIIEKETGAAFEREMIAGVFVRRLQKKMRLQTDPTVIYGMGDRYNGNIRRSDLKRKTPYNTYVIKGLPPTPIAMPGLGAIRAAMNPDSSDALYFVAKGDSTHYFSSTLEEHNKAVRKYQLRRREDYRSAPDPQNVKKVEIKNKVN